MKTITKLLVSLVLMGMLLTLTGTAWAEESLDSAGLRGQVSASEGDALTVVTRGGEEHRVIIGEDTHLRVVGVREPTVADIDIGDFIGARGERNEEGDLLAEVVIVLRAEYVQYRRIVRGQVVAVEDLTLRVQTRLGERLVITDEETRLRIPGVEDPSIDDISVGDPVLAFGRPVEEGHLLARVVAVVSGPQLRRHLVRGAISEIDGDTLSVATRLGEVEVVTSDETIFRIPGVQEPGIDDLALHDLIIALGTWEPEEEVFVARAVGLMPRWPSHLRFIRGTVTDVEEPTIVLQTLQGELGVLTDENTIFRISGVEDPGIDDLQVGDKLGALVERTGQGSVLAKVIIVRRAESSFVSEMMAPVEATTALLQDLSW